MIINHLLDFQRITWSEVKRDAFILNCICLVVSEKRCMSHSTLIQWQVLKGPLVTVMSFTIHHFMFSKQFFKRDSIPSCFSLLPVFTVPIGQCNFYFHTLTMPSRDAVTINPWVVWKVAMSVIMSWCPTGKDSGPLRGVSSVGPTFCLFWISCWKGKMVKRWWLNPFGFRCFPVLHCI